MQIEERPYRIRFSCRKYLLRLLFFFQSEDQRGAGRGRLATLIIKRIRLIFSVDDEVLHDSLDGLSQKEKGAGAILSELTPLTLNLLPETHREISSVIKGYFHCMLARKTMLPPHASTSASGE